MGFFDFLKPRDKSHVTTFRPGSKLLGISVEYDHVYKIFSYFGRFGIHFSFTPADVPHLQLKIISDTQAVLQLYRDGIIINTSDVLPPTIGESIQVWCYQQIQ